ncbi:NmrA family transcriptional regulator [Planomonospora parontospora subsp. parontospora]|uniref:NmrA family transcriptional regulator n=2 Tax=Planomonospora parontospora TaxID=58119 RepID=A0AA37BPB8_9ACTN|nr:NmrA/HSCARG family protein [Planomonospora parontospora]GGK99962.1 NmrA family transcriptional regulator [Planomonospora parontospora]GII13051.1 NmrA family transcriptional regulator [Planomonospora parontospora subsp. parontospora]
MKTIVVVGATGLQGRAVTARLLADGRRVRAVTRDPDAAPARALAQAGAELVRAEMDDVASLVAAAEGTYGLFSVQPTVGSPGTPAGFSAEDEVRWGCNVADAAHAAGVRHLVYASLAGADRHNTEKLPDNTINKWRIEQHITRLGLPATFLRPVSFMENYTGAYHLHDGAVATAFAADTPQQIMAVDDVGAFAALAFAQPGEWIGRAVDLAGDELTPRQIAAAISEAVCRPLPYVQIPIEVIAQIGEEFAYAYTWLNERGYRADVAFTRALHPGLMDLRTWLQRTGAAQIAGFLAAQDTAEQNR